MPGDITRRQLTAGLLTSASLAAQPLGGDPRALLEDGRDELRAAVEEMKKIELDINTQPAFVFKP